MDFKVWNKIKKQFSNANERRLAMIRPIEAEKYSVENQIASDAHSAKPLSNNLLEEQLASEEPKVVNDAKDRVGNIPTQMNNKDYVLTVLNDLPEQWVGKEMNLHLIAAKKDAIWVVNRIFQDVERGLINARFSVEESNHLCDIRLVLKIVPGLASFPSAVAAINPVFSFILTDIKSEVVSRRKKRTGGVPMC